MTGETPSILSERHLEAFGRIVNAYASVETVLKFGLAGITQGDIADVMIMTAPYSAYQLNSAVKSIARLKLPDHQAEKLVSFVQKWFDFTNLRTAVAHHMWKKGSLDNHIKPTFLEVTTGRAVVKGHAEKEPEYTIDDLFNKAQELRNLHSSIQAFLVEIGAQFTIDAKIS